MVQKAAICDHEVKLYDEGGNCVGVWNPVVRAAILGRKYYTVKRYVNVEDCERLEDGSLKCAICGAKIDFEDEYCRGCGAGVYEE